MTLPARWLVVGGGVAGCAVASVLSGRNDRDVTVLERGADHGVVPDAGDVGPFLDPARSAIETVHRGAASTDGYWQGSGLGGSSLINGGVVTVDGDVPLPTEPPWAVGAVGRALLATDREASPVRLVRRDRRRLTAADIFLRPVLDRPNLHVRCEATVDRIVFDRRRAVGVALVSGEVIDADAVVVTAGAIRTPTLLLRSGVTTPGVGLGLQDHPAFTFALRLRPEAIDPTVPTIAVAATHPDHQVIALDHLPGDTTLGAITVALQDVRSEGSVRLDADGEPVVEFGQFGDDHDALALAQATLSTAEMLDGAAWSAVAEAVFVDDRGTPLGRLGDVADVVDRVRARPAGHHHASATCRDGVVVDDGAVRGYDGLYVADASALPGVPRLDPLVAVVRQALCFAAAW